MNTHQHDEIRDLLTLAAAGALSSEEQKQVEEHLRSCSGCREEFAVWSRLTGALEELPTPQAPLGLVERTRRAMERQASIKAERRQQRWLFAWLTAFAWITTLLSWPVFEFVGNRVADFVDLSWTHMGVGGAWVFYILLTWTVSALAAGMLGHRRIQEERAI